MDNCFTRDYSGLGSGAGQYLVKPKFIQTRNQIISRLSSLEKETDKAKFRNKCLDLVNFLIKKKDDPPAFTERKRWVPVLRNYFKHRFDKITQHGGCPMIFEQKERDILELKYNALDFCELNNTYVKKLSKFKKGGNKYDCNSNAECKKHCTEYKDWFTGKKEHFQNTKNLISESCIFKSSSSQFPKRECNILNPKIFNKPPQCIISEPVVSSHLPPKENTLSSPNVDQIKTEVFPAPEEKHPSGKTSDSSPDSSTVNIPDSSLVHSPEGPSSDQSQLQTTSEDTSMENLVNLGVDAQHEDSELPRVLAHSASSEKTLSSFIVQSPGSPELETGSHIKTIPTATDVSIPKTPSSNPADSEIQGKFKKKKNIRRQIKFLRILLPSHSGKKDKFLSYDHLDQPIYDDEEIIKKLKIYEHNTIKNTNMLNRKKERSKTIIEVHMEVLEEFRNEEWELNKGEFLTICLEIFKNEEGRSYPNLINDYQIENIQCRSDNEETNILWNKWIERHRNLSEKLKKEHWFNNLKNKWKKEKSKVKKMEELKNKSSNENQKVSFLEGEKDIWRQWISKKGKIVEHYLEQDWFKGLTDEFDNMLDEYENEETKNCVSLISIEEMEHNKSCEELYIYIKKKLLSKLCILVFMTILEECKNEQNIENYESYLDSSINECNSGEYSDRKFHNIEHVVDGGNHSLENSKNTEIFDYKLENNFTDEIKNWIVVDDTRVNST
ncbi:STP1 protein [Plasmodium malariae]|uniref:STP1 protein n=1 Tax=Plasmodium malariae TaxID=5858 RepID=A0A1D3JHJ8_PLAMA|nr:STP1 protein [Plasmodium malariae]SBT85840.1 STP1 protein [Plasmodium malariae]